MKSGFAGNSRGFTLIEAVITIVLTGILAAVVVVFLRAPLQGYLDLQRRSDLTGVADSALRRIARDLRQALPNSIRLTGTTQIEFIPIKSAGRYRSDVASDGSGNILDFTSGIDTTFDVLGPGITTQANDFFVIYNLGITGADAYAGLNRRQVNAVGTNLSTGTFTATGTPFPFGSPARRFHVVGRPVSYICNAGVLTRFWDYAYGAAPATGSSAPLANNVSACTFAYEPGATAQNALVTLRLDLTRDGETISLVHQIHVNNAP